MKRTYQLFFLIVCLCIISSGCFQEKGNVQEDEDVPEVDERPEESPIEEVIETPEVTVSPIDELIGQLSLEEKIGQLMVIGVEGTTYSQDMDNLIRNYHVGGIILMGKNVATPSGMLQLINDSKKGNQSNDIPLFVSVDEEGGRVSRLPAGFKKLPSNGQIGKRNDEAFNYRVGTYLAEVLSVFGYNVNFAPVLDVNSNPKNPVIGDRSFGDSPEQVATLGIQTMRGMMDHGIIPVVKHFPGHGDTFLDSHHALPIVHKSFEDLQKFELMPFKKAIDEGADMVMVAHISYPLLDPDFPSSMSKVILTDILRNELHFNGVIITDDLTMGAIENQYTVPEAALQSFIAGSDLLLIADGYDQEIETFNTLKNAVETGLVSEERINESLKRILLLKDAYELTDEIIETVDVEKINRLYDELLAS